MALRKSGHFSGFKYGNILSNTLAGSYSYDYSSLPHAVRSVVNGQSGSQSYGYDTDGNMTDHSGDAIVYDWENRPAGITTSSGQILSFFYDYKGQRVRKSSPSETTYYVGELYEQTGAKSTCHILSGGKRIADVVRQGGSAPTIYYFLPDHLGSLGLVTDQAGKVVQKDYYYPFGKTASGSTLSSEDVSSYKFTGKEEDEETGLYYYGARYYDPALGRFITPDTVVPDYTNPQGLNRYAYCRNNPLIYIDPSGHFEFLSDGTFSGFTQDAWLIGQNSWNQMAADWASGNYFDSFIDSASFFVNNGILLPASVAADGILTAPYNSGTNWSAGFVSGDWDRTLHGSAELGTIGFLGYLEALSSLSSLASLPSEGAGIASESGIGRVFWSGGDSAREAAEAWAKTNGATTLEMTKAGQSLTAATKGLDWLTEAKPMWERASADFARGASGEIHVFQDGIRGVSLESMWRNIEYPILQQQGDTFIYHLNP